MAEDIHGNTGMEIHNYELPEPTVAVEDTDAVDLIIDTVMNNEPGTVALVPTGPLTNIALAVRKEPRIAERVTPEELIHAIRAVDCTHPGHDH